MRGFDRRWVAVLSRAIDAGRLVLRDLDDAELTPPLRRLAAYQGGRLPPPLALRLLRELDENAWFRDKTAESWEGPEDDPAALFLTRPPGWLPAVAAAVHDEGTGADDKRVADLEAQNARIEAKRLEEAKRAKVAKKAAQDAQRAAKQMVESAKKAASAKNVADREAASAAREELGILRDRFAALDAEYRELQQAFDGVRARLAKARRGRFDGGDRTGESSWVPADSVKLARLLDLQTAEFGRHRAIPTEMETPEVAPLTLASGVRPDSSDAIRWLLALEDPVAVLVDGYNAQFHVDREDFTSGSARRHLADALKRLRSAAAVKHRVVVVYDSTLPGDRIPRTSLGGVEIRFAEEDRIADEEIVDMAAGLDRVVVISSDRAVREGAEDNGAVVLWSEALADWLGRF